MARSRSPKGQTSNGAGRPKKWGDQPVQQIHVDVPVELAKKFKDAADADLFSLVDFLIVVACDTIGEPRPRAIKRKPLPQEALPLTA